MEEDIRKHFPRSYTKADMQKTIMSLLEKWQKQRERNRRDERWQNDILQIYMTKIKKYCFNGVTYTVESHFEKPDMIHFADNNCLKHCIQKYLTGDFAELQGFEKGNTIDNGYKCSTVGKTSYKKSREK